MDTDAPQDPPATDDAGTEDQEPSAASPDPEHDEGGPGPGEAPTDEPAAQGDHTHADDLVGDWAVPDVDLSGLTPTDDGDPDDDLAEQGRRLANEREDLIAAGADPADLAVPLHPDQAALDTNTWSGPDL